MANKVYVTLETALLFADSAQTPAATLTLTNLASGAGRVSARYDRGASAHAGWYAWRATFQLASAGTVGQAIELYLATSDGTNVDGEVGTSDAALTSDKRRNLVPLGLVIVDTTSTNTDITASGLVFVPERYLSVGVWNATAVGFRADTSVHGVTLTPAPDEIQ